jgi:AcrR family transcriptional regulator
MAKVERRYGGVTIEQRKSERRERLVRAAIEVAARAGIDGATVAAICAEAELTARYFYEEFGHRDALFLEAHRRVQQELFAKMGSGSAGRDPVKNTLSGFFRVLSEYPAHARVFLLDVDETDPAVKAVGRAAGAYLGSLFAPAVTDPLVLFGVSGAVVTIARRWIESGFAEPVEHIVARALPFARAAVEADKAAKAKR